MVLISIKCFQKWLLIILFVCSISTKINADLTLTTNSIFEPRVMTKYGELQGSSIFINGTYVHSYLGIPYAQPPTGTRRFQKAAPVSKWSGVKQAIAMPSICMQPDLSSSLPGVTVTGEEDCLFLNVHTPYDGTATRKLIPVMVWVHGGGYVFGSGSGFNGSLLAALDVVVVTINYRLGLFGFLSTDDGIIPGNFGMMDQIEALKWIKENVASFGGDPNDVTVFGESAGAASVSLLMLSPLAKGLFKKAIMESGNSLVPRGIVEHTDTLSPSSFTELVSSAVGCKQRDTLLTLHCLQGIDSVTLLKECTHIVVSLNGLFAFKPRVENSFGFLPDEPRNLLRKGEFANVATLRGYNSQELGAAVNDEDNDGVTIDEIKQTIKRSLPSFYGFYNNCTRVLDDLYVVNKSNPFELRSVLVRLLTDISFVAPTVMELNMFISANPTSNHFLYQFGYRASYIQTPVWAGVQHTSELPFVFGISETFVNQLGLGMNVSPSDDDIKLNENIMKMWTNFAKSGNPSHGRISGIVWHPYQLTDKNILLLDSPLQLSKFNRPKLQVTFKDFLDFISSLFSGDANIVG